MSLANPVQAAPIVDLEAIKAKQQATWGSGDYAVIGTTLQIVGEQLCETANLVSGSTVLDVAAGNGNATLAAARRFCQVTSTDYVGTLLERGSQRAEAERLKIDFQVADAENLPFDNDSYDAVISTYGVMFTPNQAQAAAEMVRVCRPGGTIALANWTPEGFIGQVFKCIGKHVPPAAGLNPPSRWGTEAGIEQLFGNAVDVVAFKRRDFNFRYCSAEHFLDIFRRYYGPIHKAFAALDEAGARALEADFKALLAEGNTATDGSLVVPSEYVEVVLRKRG
ncbi:methyltransferase domain-containing protein [Halioxenophilus sp. WMMB6]|uniref:methyltransferase domain-containing protein n=1 Tax=Halioxenophilus sp. WMMB6 TaxID=3073815 RepID=UPI00295EC8D1|nr:methyltransferase domain-containing protein [Halioxenophilus sp. WMMB6]